MNELKKGLYFSPDDGAGDGNSGDEKPADKQEKTPLEWDAFHGSLPEEAQNLIATHEGGLKTALETERDSRGQLEKDLKDVAGELEKGSDAQKEVLKLADKVAAGDRKIDFYEDAQKAGISNFKLAYHIAKDDDLFDKRGNVNFEKMKESYPELFTKKKAPPADGGEGTGGGLPGEKVDMNALIRKKAGW